MNASLGPTRSFGCLDDRLGISTRAGAIMCNLLEFVEMVAVKIYRI